MSRYCRLGFFLDDKGQNKKIQRQLRDNMTNIAKYFNNTLFLFGAVKSHKIYTTIDFNVNNFLLLPNGINLLQRFQEHQFLHIKNILNICNISKYSNLQPNT